MAERYTHVLTPDQIEAARKWETFMYGPQPKQAAQKKGPARKDATR